MQPCQSTMQRCLQGRNPTSCCKSAKFEAPAALTATQRALHARRSSSKQSRVGPYEGLQQIAHIPAPAPTTSPQRREYAGAAQKVASDTWVASRRAVVTAGVSMLMAGSAAPSYAANDALLRRLQQKQNEDAGAEIAGPSAARAGRILVRRKSLQQLRLREYCRTHPSLALSLLDVVSVLLAASSLPPAHVRHVGTHALRPVSDGTYQHLAQCRQHCSKSARWSAWCSLSSSAGRACNCGRAVQARCAKTYAMFRSSIRRSQTRCAAAAGTVAI